MNPVRESSPLNKVGRPYVLRFCSFFAITIYCLLFVVKNFHCTFIPEKCLRLPAFISFYGIYVQKFAKNFCGCAVIRESFYRE